MLQQKIVFIGGGNMAEGMIKGFLLKGIFQPQEIRIFDILAERMEYLETTYQIKQASDLAVAVRGSSIILLAVGPQDFEKAASSIKDFITKEQLVVSICAGITIEKLMELFQEHKKFARIMPNTMIETGFGYSAVCTSAAVGDAEQVWLDTMLNALGRSLQIKESLFNAFTAYSCAGPAYVLYFLAAMIDAGVQSGFSRTDATAIASENLLAATTMVQQTGKHPYQITDTMTSPAGITIDGLQVLSEKGFHGIVMSSVKQAVARTNEVGMQSDQH